MEKNFTQGRKSLFLLLFLLTVNTSVLIAGPQGDKMSLEQAIQEISVRYDVYFTYNKALVQEITVDLDFSAQQTLEEVMEEVLVGTKLRYRIHEDKYVIIYKSDREGISSLKKMAKQLDVLIDQEESRFLSHAHPVQILKSKEAFQPLQLIRGRLGLNVSGTVTDQSGEPLIGVNVLVKGTTKGTATDFDGRFEIEDINENAILVFSYVGYQTVELEVAGRSDISLMMNEDLQTLDEVIVIGYGTQKKSSVTGAVNKIGSSELQGKPVANVSQALQGVSPNLIIQQRNFEPGQGLNINIRGLGTLGDNNPLIVIDGIIGEDINLLNPNDIENISVLKDAGSAAIYGSRAANGVILITTKSGRKNEIPSLTYNGIYGFTNPKIMVEPVHGWENAYFKNESLVNSGRQPVFSPTEISEFAKRGDGDWRLDNIMQNAPQQTHSVRMQGGSDLNTYMVSLGYMNQGNNFVGPNYGWERYNARLNQSIEIDRFKLTTGLSYVKTYGKDHSSSASTLIVDAARVPLYYDFQDSTGQYLTNAVSAEFNSKAILEEGGYRKYNNDEIAGNMTAEYSIMNDLKLRGVFGGIVRANRSFGRKIELSFSPGGQYGSDREVYDSDDKSLMLNSQLLLEYQKTLQHHDVNILIGASNESFKSEGSKLTKTYVDPEWGIPTTGTIVDPNSSNSNQATVENSLNSLFGRTVYSYANRYYGEFSFRYDGSSNFPAEGRWGFFPSGSLAWRVTEEGKMENFRNNIGDLKLRASYGILGNQNVKPYQYQTTYFNYSDAYGFNNEVVGGAGFTLGNPEITWEKAATLNAGIDITLFNQRLDIAFDVFNKITSDILVARDDVPDLFGAGFPDYNVAKVRNRGWETNITYRIPGQNFRHFIQINLADNNNTLLEYTYGADEQVLRKEEFEFVRRIGLPITVYQGLRRDGYYQTPDDLEKYPAPGNTNVSPGDIRFKDKNGDGIIDDNDKYILGNPFPRLTFGFNYGLEFKSFDFQVFIQGVGQRDMMIRGELVEPFHVGYGGTMYRHQTDYWTPTNPDAAWPKLAESGSPSNQNNYRMGSDLYLFDASYARLKNVQIGYRLPKSLIDHAGMKDVHFYLTGQNLYTMTNMQFLDPEVTEFGNNTSMSANASSGRAYPLPVFYGVGLDITF